MPLITINNPSIDPTFGILENPLKATPNGYEPTDVMLLKSFSPVYLFVTYGKYPATTRNPYIVLFGFVTVAEQIGIKNLKSKGISTTNTSLKDIVEKDIIKSFPNNLGFVCGIISNAVGTHNFWGHIYAIGAASYGIINIQLLGSTKINTLKVENSVAIEAS